MARFFQASGWGCNLEQVSLQLPLDQGLELVRDLTVPRPTHRVGSPLGRTGLGVTSGSHPVPGLDRLLLPMSEQTLRDIEGLCYADPERT